MNEAGTATRTGASPLDAAAARADQRQFGLARRLRRWLASTDVRTPEGLRRAMAAWYNWRRPTISMWFWFVLLLALAALMIRGPMVFVFANVVAVQFGWLTLTRIGAATRPRRTRARRINAAFHRQLALWRASPRSTADQQAALDTASLRRHWWLDVIVQDALSVTGLLAFMTGWALFEVGLGTAPVVIGAGLWLGAVGVALACFRAHHAIAVAHKRLCPACGYDLIGLPALKCRCPECGVVGRR